MKTAIEPLLSPTREQLANLGERLRLARLRRQLGVDALAAAAGLSRVTLFRIEKGSASVAMGAYARVMEALGIAGDLVHVAQADPVGRQLQDQMLPERRAPAGRVRSPEQREPAQDIWAFKRLNQAQDVAAVRAGRSSNASMSWFTEKQAAGAEIVGEPL